MNAPRAVDLPIGSRVGHQGRTYIRDRSDEQGWQCGPFGFYLTAEIQSMLNNGAKVLRVGDGQ